MLIMKKIIYHLVKLKEVPSDLALLLGYRLTLLSLLIEDDGLLSNGCDLNLLGSKSSLLTNFSLHLILYPNAF